MRNCIIINKPKYFVYVKSGSCCHLFLLLLLLLLSRPLHGLIE